MKVVSIKKLWNLCVLICMCAMLFCGCAPNIIHIGQGDTTPVTDATGTIVDIPNHPNRIVPLGVSTEDIVLSMVPANRIAAIGSLPNNLPDISDTISGRVKANAESILSVKPDIVILPDWLSLDAVQEMRNLHIPVYVYKTPKSVADSEAVIKELGNLLHTSDTALLDSMHHDLQKVQDIVNRHSNEPKFVVAYYTKFGLTGGKGSTFDDMCRYMHVNNAATMVGLGPIDNGTRENLIQVNPDIIVIPSDVYNTEQYSEINLQDLYSDPSLQQVKAIQNKRVYMVDARQVMSYSQFMTKAILDMTRYIYGEA